MLDQLLTLFVHLLRQLGRHRILLRRLVRVLAETHGHVADNVHCAGELVLLPNRYLDDRRRGLQTIANHADRAPEVGAGAIHLVDEADAGHAVLVGLVPDGLRLGLHAGHAIKYHYATVQHAQAALHFHGEIHVARGIDDVDAMVAPETGGSGRRDGNTTLSLLIHPVHHRRTLVGLAQLVGTSSEKEDAFGHSRLTRVDMGNDADVANHFNCDRSGHLIK